MSGAATVHAGEPAADVAQAFAAELRAARRATGDVHLLEAARMVEAEPTAPGRPVIDDSRALERMGDMLLADAESRVSPAARLVAREMPAR